MITSPYSLCHNCWNDTTKCGELSCIKCSLPIVGLVSENLYFDKKIQKMVLKCDFCHATSYNFDALFSSCLYSPTTAKLAAGLKFGGRVENAKFFANQIMQRLQSQNTFSFDVITCVPLSKKGLFNRRYNQSALIALYLHKALSAFSDGGIVFVPDLLSKTKHTKPQTKLNKQQRIENLKDCFCLNHRAVSNLTRQNVDITNKTILLVDDVATTLSTLNEVSHTLSRSGIEPKFIVAATFARVDIV
jgi:competence protein ComFC